MSDEGAPVSASEGVALQRYRDFWRNVLLEIPGCGNADCERRALLAIHRLAVEDLDWMGDGWPDLTRQIGHVAEMSMDDRTVRGDRVALRSFRSLALRELRAAGGSVGDG